MSRTDCCYDNAVIERFFSSLKYEWTNHRRFANLKEAQLSVFLYIETFYNRRRLHELLGYRSPNEYEAEHDGGPSGENERFIGVRQSWAIASMSQAEPVPVGIRLYDRKEWKARAFRAVFWTGIAFARVLLLIYMLPPALSPHERLRWRADIHSFWSARIGSMYLKVGLFDPRRLTLEPADLDFLPTHSRLGILELNAPYIGESKWWEREDCGILIPADLASFERCLLFSDSDTLWMDKPRLRKRMPQLIAAVRQSLQGLEHDRELPISLGRLDDRLLKHIGQCRGLKALFLAGNPITNEGLKELETLDDLMILSLEGTQISDEGLTSVARLRSLKVLVLTNTRITDSGLDKLQTLDRLIFLETNGTRVTEVGLKRLRERTATLRTKAVWDVHAEVVEAVFGPVPDE